jgi:cyanophycin synthetase
MGLVMNIHRFRTLPGPNIFCHRPMLVMELDLGELYAVDSHEVPGFVDRLLACLPGLRDHHCASGQPGGFVKRLYDGTYFGHIVEHVALELTDAVGISTNRGKTVAGDVPGRYLVAVEYRSEPGMRHLLETAVGLVQSLVRDEPYPLEARLQAAREVVAQRALGPSTQAIVDAAERRGIPWTRVSEGSRVRLGTGKTIRHVEATVTDRTSVIAVDLVADKHETKRVLRAAGLPVPQGCVVTSREEAIRCLDDHRTGLTPGISDAMTPVVIKPLDGHQGKGVSLNLLNAEQVGEAFDLAAEVSRRVIVEEMLRGNDYRVVVVGGRMVAAAQRIPAHVWGDGRHTVAELIELANHDPRRGNDHEKPMTKIQTDPVVIALLKRQGHTLENVPGSGEMVLLRESANLSTGGEARDVTDRVHPTVRRMCERAARVVGLDVCGVDVVLPDIEQPFTSGGIVEMNAAPGIRMHHFPAEGSPRDVGGAIVDMLYPTGAPTHIPVISITGTNGKTTVTRMVAHVLRQSGVTVGMTTTDGIWIGEDAVAAGDMTGPWSAGVVLSDPSVDVAVLETARGGIIRGGLGYDWSDVGVITNIQADHLGQDGIESVDDIAAVKRLVAERVRDGGTLVLNADDEQLLKLAVHRRVVERRKQFVYFSLTSDHPALHYHVEKGGTAFVLNDGWIEERSSGGASRLIRAEDVPATLGGTAEFQIANVLAATAASFAAHASREAVVAGLLSFDPCQHGSGRVNVFAVHGGYAVVDYAHNPAAISALCRMARDWAPTRLTLVLGVPGDRSDDLIRQSARAGAAVDRLIIREDIDTRGRRRGAVADLLGRSARESAPALSIDVIYDEREAVTAATQAMQEGEVVLLLCERVYAVVERLASHGAQPLANFRGVIAKAAQPAAT